jgi:hypothetical protein
VATARTGAGCGRRRPARRRAPAEAATKSDRNRGCTGRAADRILSGCQRVQLSLLFLSPARCTVLRQQPHLCGRVKRRSRDGASERTWLVFSDLRFPEIFFTFGRSRPASNSLALSVARSTLSALTGHVAPPVPEPVHRGSFLRLFLTFWVVAFICHTCKRYLRYLRKAPNFPGYIQVTMMYD